MMGDDRLLDLQPLEFHNVCLGASLQPYPGACLREPGRNPGREHTGTFEPPEPTRPSAPPRGSGQEPAHPGSCSSQGDLRPAAVWPESQGNHCSPGSPPQNQGTSTQVVFWAGILQAQMCVLDLEEELEKTEGLRNRLRCCLPASTPDPPGNTGLHPSTTQEEEEEEKNCGEDRRGPEEENHAWPRDGSPGSSPEWGPEEESLFFDNPLFLESPCSDTSVSREYFSWGFPNSQADSRPGPDWPPPGSGGPWEPESELDLGDSTAGSSGGTTPPFPVPPYKSHPFCWALLGPTEDSQVPPPAEEEGKAPLEDECGPVSLTGLRGDKTWAQETVHLEPDLSPAAHPLQPWVLTSAEGWQTEEAPFWSLGRGERDDRHPQETALRTLAPSPCGSPMSSPDPDSPVSEGRSPGPRPTPVSSQEGSPQLQRHSPVIVPKWPLDASYPSLLETDGLEPTSLKRDEAAEAPDTGQEVECEGPVGTAGAADTQPDVRWTCAEGPAETPMPQARPPEEDQGPLAGDKLENGVPSDRVAWNLASRLYRLDGFRKSEVAAYLRKNNDFSRAVAEEYLSFFQFRGQSLDCALRSFLQALVLSGETQERERILYQFSRRFYHCNPEAFPSVDSIHTLTCAIMLLNTDLHGQNIGKSMSCQEFITNLNGLQDGRNFPKELLKALYWSIRTEKLEWAMDEEEAARPEKAQPSPAAGKMSNPFLQLAQDPTVPTYKQGILARKMHHDADGKKTPWGKRSWKMFHTLLRGMVLYFLKGEDHSVEAESLVGQMVDEPIGVHHALATQATHYTKKPHVFQLRTADWRLYLFQAPTAKEMTSWIARINLAAATHSAPPFPAAVGSQRRFVRPILPVGPAQNSLVRSGMVRAFHVGPGKSSEGGWHTWVWRGGTARQGLQDRQLCRRLGLQEEQHRSHENCLDAASDDLLDLQRNLPERRGRSRELEEYRLRKEYLEYEKTRYETYVQLLVARLHCASGDLDLWEEQLGREAEDTWEPKPSLKKSHSSPSLHQDEAPTTAKVKRNISERRTYRKIIPKRNRNQL